jgi:heme-degrading monooxygenase HmoA
MYARVVSGAILPDKIDDVIRLWHESVVPTAKRQKGFISARLLVDRANSRVLSMGLWETEADFQASVQWNEGQLAKFTEMVQSPPTVAGYEVAGYAESLPRDP